MSKYNIIEQLLSQSTEFNYNEVILSLIISTILTIILGKIYVKFGTSLSNRRKFANNLLLIGITTTLVISIIKSSLALSLGLVGSLSIIRFRTSIKEPEELAFVFLTVAIGLGSGAYQYYLTTISLMIIIPIIIIRGITSKKKDETQNMHIIITTQENTRINLKKITEILKNNSHQLRLKRFDINNENIEVAYIIDIKKIEDLNNIKEKIKELSRTASITYLDND